MRTLSILLIYLLFLQLNLIGQTTIKGVVVSKTNSAIPYSSVYMQGSKIGAACNHNGQFNLMVKEILISDTLVVSSVGYVTKKVALHNLPHQQLSIVLEPSINMLNEVVITPTEFQAKDIWKKVLTRYSKNYEQSAYYQEGFYRELLSENNFYIKLNECTFNYQVPKRAKKKYSNRAFNYYWTDYWHSGKPQIQHYLSDFAQYWPTFISPAEQIQAVEFRGSLDNSSRTQEKLQFGDPLGGPKDLISLNQLRFNTQVFFKKLKDQYQLSDKGLTTINGKECYVIHFEPSHQNLNYSHNWSKKVETPLYAGELFIDTKTFALVKLNCQSINFDQIVTLFKNESKSLNWKYRPNKLAYTIQFNNNDEELWYVKSIDFKAEYIDSSNNSSIKRAWERTLVLSEPMKVPDVVEGVDFPLTNETIRHRNHTYNKPYWNKFENSQLYIPLKKNVLSDLETSAPLQQQYAFVNKPISEVVLGMHSICHDTSAYHQLELYNSFSNQILNKLQDTTYGFLQDCYDLLNHQLKTNSKQSYKAGYQLIRDTLNQHLYYVYIDSAANRTNLLDVSAELSKYPSWQLYDIQFSNQLIVFSLSKTGVFYNKLIIQDIGTNKNLLSISKVTEFEILDSQVYVTTQNQYGRTNKLKRIDLSKQPLIPEVILSEPHNEYEIEIKLSDSKEFLFVSSESKQQNSVGYFNRVDHELHHLTQLRAEHLTYRFNHFTTNVYIFYAERNSINFNLFKFDTDTRNRTIIHSNKHRINDFIVHNNSLTYTEYKLFNEELFVLNLSKYGTEKLPLEKTFKSIELNHHIQNDSLHFSTEGTFDEPKNYSLNLTNNQLNILKKKESVYKFERKKNQYAQKIVWVKSSDGSYNIPVLVSYDRTKKVESLLLQVYGAYEAIYTPSFEVETIVLMNKGYAIARPAVRGSGIDSYKAYQAGSRLNKTNTFTDFVDVVKHLQSEFQVNNQSTFARGLSAGGLIMGVMVNNYPNLFGGIVLDRPFVNVSASMNDSTLLLTTLEYQEWGNPSDSNINKFLNSYSPLKNAPHSLNTNVFVRGSFKDFNTPIYPILSYTNKLNCSKSNKLVLFKTSFKQDHYVRYTYSTFAEEYGFFEYCKKQKKSRVLTK